MHAINIYRILLLENLMKSNEILPEQTVTVIHTGYLEHIFHMHDPNPVVLIHPGRDTMTLGLPEIIQDIPAQQIVIICGHLPFHDLAVLCLERSVMALDDLSSIIQVANTAIFHYSSHVPLNKKYQKTRFKQIPRSARKSGCRGR